MRPQSTTEVTLWRAEAPQTAERDAYGNAVVKYTPTPLKGVLIDWGGSASTDTDRGERSTNSATLYLPTGVLIKPTDRVEFGGFVWQPQGFPKTWGTVTGLHHVQPGTVIEVTMSVEGQKGKS